MPELPLECPPELPTDGGGALKGPDKIGEPPTLFWLLPGRRKLPFGTQLLFVGRCRAGVGSVGMVKGTGGVGTLWIGGWIGGGLDVGVVGVKGRGSGGGLKPLESGTLF